VYILAGIDHNNEEITALSYSVKFDARRNLIDRLKQLLGGSISLKYNINVVKMKLGLRSSQFIFEQKKKTSKNLLKSSM